MKCTQIRSRILKVRRAKLNHSLAERDLCVPSLAVLRTVDANVGDIGGTGMRRFLWRRLIKGRRMDVLKDEMILKLKGREKMRF
jgi:hypothetical protein